MVERQVYPIQAERRCKGFCDPSSGLAVLFETAEGCIKLC